MNPVARLHHCQATNPLYDVPQETQPMHRLIIVLLALALSACASPGQRLVDMERCAGAVPPNIDENAQGRAMERCMRAKGYWVMY